MRYFLDTVSSDESFVGHEIYMVSENKRAEWERLLREPANTPLGEEPKPFVCPPYAQRVNGALRSVSFTAPQEGDTPIHF